ncbi:MAG: hypothetical protein E6G83_19240 [Alphaproteobacteria bacterium]|nr:MAG: hypothetical protein E6G83_19240 [Alphaproteobacteria bacterium]
MPRGAVRPFVLFGIARLRGVAQGAEESADSRCAGSRIKRLQACFALIAAVCDTNLLPRGGAEGICHASKAATSFLSPGGVGAPDWRARAAAAHAAFVAWRLSPGGFAELLAMTPFVDALESRVALRSAMCRWPAS